MDELDESDMKRNTSSDDTRDLHLDDIAASIDSVDIRDDFMFSYVMCNREICTELLQYLLPGHKISRIEYYELGDGGTGKSKVGTEHSGDSSKKYEPLQLDAQKSLNEAFNRRTVRLDVYLDDGKSVYNLEMQTTRHAALLTKLSTRLKWTTNGGMLL